MLRFERARAEAKVRDADSDLCAATRGKCLAAITTAASDLAACQKKMAWQDTKKRRMDDDHLIIIDGKADIMLNEEARRWNDQLRIREEDEVAALGATPWRKSASVQVKLTAAAKADLASTRRQQLARQKLQRLALDRKRRKLQHLAWKKLDQLAGDRLNQPLPK